MARKIYYTEQKEFTLTEKDEETGVINKSVIPPKYSPEDKYGEYRRKAKNQDFFLVFFNYNNTILLFYVKTYDTKRII
ncbi:MAG: nucleolar RNA-binding Nop10p family protein [Candidatus Woesearchaeota archaeon]